MNADLVPAAVLNVLCTLDHLILKTIQYYLLFYKQTKNPQGMTTKRHAQCHTASEVPGINYSHESIYKS